jgi:membrane protein implicated in regulation of membrane protease activity
MKLITAHRILIGAGIVFFVFYAAIQLKVYLASGAGGALAQAVVSVAIAVGFVIYYRSLRRRWDKPS